MNQEERLEYLAAMVASGGASPIEEEELDALLLAHPSAREEVAAFADVMSEVALGLPPQNGPTAGLEKLRAAIPASTVSAGQGAPGAAVISLASRRKQRLTVAFAGAFAAAAAAFAFLWMQQKQELTSLQSRASGIESQLAERERAYRSLTREYADETDRAAAKIAALSRQFEVVGASDVQLTSMRAQGANPAHAVNIFIKPGQRWVAIGNLPDPGPGKDYQLWFVPKNGAPISAGVFERVEGKFQLEVQLPGDLPDLQAAAVSLEPAGGSKAPTEVKMAGNLI